MTTDFFDLNLQGAANHTPATDDHAEVHYRVKSGAFPSGLTGNGYYTAWDRGSADDPEGPAMIGASF